MIAIARPMPTLFNLPEQVWRGADAVTIGLAAGSDGSRDVGILRPERALCRPSDVRAALADPTLPEVVARALGRR